MTHFFSGQGDNLCLRTGQRSTDRAQTHDDITESNPATPGAQWYIAERLNRKTEDHSSSTSD